MPKQLGLLCALVLLSTASGLANDTSAELATGGLVFVKSDYIDLLSEDLFVSMKQVRVQYHFFNHSDREVTTQIAFPMPDVPYGVDDFNFVIPTEDPENILNFTTTVNGRPVGALVERKALLDGIDKTEVLRKLGVPIAPKLGQKYDYLSQETWNQLIRLGLIQDAPRSDGYIQPRWTLKTTYYWQQTFPAHQEIVIDHSYLPSVGGTVPMSASDLLANPINLEIDPARGLNRFCIDQDFLNTIKMQPKMAWGQHYLEYILVTGANWSGPIKTFRLVVDKGSPDNLVSFCGRGVRKISPTQFEMRVAQFVPTANLSVLILLPRPRKLLTINRLGSIAKLKIIFIRSIAVSSGINATASLKRPGTAFTLREAFASSGTLVAGTIINTTCPYQIEIGKCSNWPNKWAA